jgi:hypothetical protein
MNGIDNIEHGWIGSENQQCEGYEPVFHCALCGADIYAGNDYYEIFEERLCCECISNCKCRAR